MYDDYLFNGHFKVLLCLLIILLIQVLIVNSFFLEFEISSKSYKQMYFVLIIIMIDGTFFYVILRTFNELQFSYVI